jgi:putative transposase
LFRFKTWKQDLEFYDISGIKSVPQVPFSHPFIESLIGTVRRDFTDRTILWSKRDDELKLDLYKDYYNNFRVHDSLEGKTPNEYTGKEQNMDISSNSYRWVEKCGGIFSTPAAIVSRLLKMWATCL